MASAITPLKLEHIKMSQHFQMDDFGATSTSPWMPRGAYVGTATTHADIRSFDAAHPVKDGAKFAPGITADKAATVGVGVRRATFQFNGDQTWMRHTHRN